MIEETVKKEAHRVALEALHFEIDLLWRRSLFFGGFVSVAFAGYVVLWPSRPMLALVLAGFGMVCSFAWVLVNRGSKYWQEVWEARIRQHEDAVTGPWLEGWHERADSGLLGGKRFSVGRVAIALSLYVFLIWTGLVLWQVLSMIYPVDFLYFLPVVVVFSCVYLRVLYAQQGKEASRADS